MSNSQTLDILKVSNQLMDYVTVFKNPLNLIEMKEKVKPKKKVKWCNIFCHWCNKIPCNTTDRYTTDVSRVNLAVWPKRSKSTQNHMANVECDKYPSYLWKTYFSIHYRKPLIVCYSIDTDYTVLLWAYSPFLWYLLL